MLAHQPDLIPLLLLLSLSVTCLPVFLIMLGRRNDALWPRLLLLCGLAVGLLGLTRTRDGAALLDLVSQPAHVRGQVIDRSITVIRPGSAGSREDFAETRYDITVHGRAWEVSAHDYAVAEASPCVIVTYGPHSGLVMGVQACAAVSRVAPPLTYQSPNSVRSTRAASMSRSQWLRPLR